MLAVTKYLMSLYSCKVRGILEISCKCHAGLFHKQLLSSCGTIRYINSEQDIRKHVLVLELAIFH